MDEVEDVLRPSTIDVQRVYTQSLQRWSSQAKKSYLQKKFPPETLRLRTMLGKVPSYLSHNLVGIREHNEKPEFDLHTKAFSNGISVLYVNGQSLWNVGGGDCDLDKKIMSHRLLLGVQSSVSCYFSGDSQFANWPGFNDYDETQSGGGNCLAILVFAWSYILSARWLEIQQESGNFPVQLNDRIVYLRHQAGWRDDTSENLLDTIDINLGDIDDDAARWWAAILAKDEGWRAEIKMNDNVYRSPWSTTSTTADYKFRLRRRKKDPQSSFDLVSTPPSSEVALGYLSDFCYLHKAGSQSSAALAAVLTFPSVTKTSLPLPICHDPYLQTGVLKADALLSKNSSSLDSESVEENVEIFRDYGLLPFYMTLSCSSRGLESLLCNTFFNPHIPCNLVSAWIQPIFEVLDPIIARKDHEVLAILLAAQRPDISALWTGAIITGMAQSILRNCRNGLIAIEIHSAAWTNTTQTFMSLDPQPLPNADRIYRSDECRLLYLAGEELNSRLPVCPWRPFGTTALCDTDICVRTHMNCKAGHYLSYDSWSWILKNDKGVEDPGFYIDKTEQDIHSPVEETLILEAPKESARVTETISETLTRNIFAWLRSYGWPAAEKAIYTHSWIFSEESDDESGVDPEADISDPGKVKNSDNKIERIAAWLNQCEDGI